MSTVAPQKHWRATLERIEKALHPVYFSDVNISRRTYGPRHPVVLKRWRAPGRVSFSEAAGQNYEDMKVGDSMGPAWSTHWVRVQIVLPKDWPAENIHFLWDSGCEALVWHNGIPQQGLTGSADGGQARKVYKLPAGQRDHVLFVEVACNGMFGVGRDGMINAPDPDRSFSLAQAEVAVFHPQMARLEMCLKLLHDIASGLGESSMRGARALLVANAILNKVDYDDAESVQHATDVALAFFSQHGGSDGLRLSLIGHCHIDTAWLWPYAETVRKCARSWASTLRLMDEYPELIFACSQAQQFEWVQVNYPALFEQLRARVSEGRFVPVGGAWVEMDGNLPCGESFARQLLYGQRYFQSTFGRKCTEFWLPDTFGYSGQLPQLITEAGMSSFMSQKLSWNLTNTFPHSSFFWCGIDGTQVLTHFPPAAIVDTYGASVSIDELLGSVKRLKDKGRTSNAMLLYGYGDGGGGPNEEMLQRARLLQDVDGLPSLEHRTPKQFFELVAKDAPSLLTWTGELYLELHRGTFTTHAATKASAAATKGNRVCESLLRDTEIASVAATLFASAEYPRSTLTRAWRLLLLNQFHDVLPGSCIQEVFDDAQKYYLEIEALASDALVASLRSLARAAATGDETSASAPAPVPASSSSEQTPEHAPPHLAFFNALGFHREEVVRIPKAVAVARGIDHQDTDGAVLVVAAAPPMSLAPLTPVNVAVPVSVQQIDTLFVLQNQHITAAIRPDGTLASLLCRSTATEPAREAIRAGSVGNVFMLYEDIPLFWDAWDTMEYSWETGRAQQQGTVSILENGPLRATVLLSLAVGKASRIEQRISLTATSRTLEFHTTVDWHENRKMLRVQFGVACHSPAATYEVQYGAIQRPTHMNTSWDAARFECAAQRWVALEEHGFGVALLNNCKYGHAVRDNTMHLSLLRSSKAPDAEADMGTHTFTYALLPYRGSWQSAEIICDAAALNSPLRRLPSHTPVKESPSLFSVASNSKSVVLDCIKLAEDNDDVIVRLYEAYGATAFSPRLSSPLPFKTVVRQSILEESHSDVWNLSWVDGGVVLPLIKPFQVVTLRLTC